MRSAQCAFCQADDRLQHDSFDRSYLLEPISQRLLGLSRIATGCRPKDRIRTGEMCARDVQIAIAGVLRARSDDCASIGYATPWADTAVSNEQTLKILYAPAHGPAEIVIALEALPATPHNRFEVTLIV